MIYLNLWFEHFAQYPPMAFNNQAMKPIKEKPRNRPICPPTMPTKSIPVHKRRSSRTLTWSFSSHFEESGWSNAIASMKEFSGSSKSIFVCSSLMLIWPNFLNSFSIVFLSFSLA